MKFFSRGRRSCTTLNTCWFSGNFAEKVREDFEICREGSRQESPLMRTLQICVLNNIKTQNSFSNLWAFFKPIYFLRPTIWPCQFFIRILFLWDVIHIDFFFNNLGVIQKAFYTQRLITKRPIEIQILLTLKSVYG